MGIRYYAYGYDIGSAEHVLDSPRSYLPVDPLADAWGLAPGAKVNYAAFKQAVSVRDMLYLDKAWGHLQVLTAPTTTDEPARPAHRMFEGNVVMDGLGWDPWVRALAPDEMPEIARDLRDLANPRAPSLHRRDTQHELDRDGEGAYTWEYLLRAQRFVSALAAEGRGMVYMIG